MLCNLSPKYRIVPFKIIHDGVFYFTKNKHIDIYIYISVGLIRLPVNWGRRILHSKIISKNTPPRLP